MLNNQYMQNPTLDNILLLIIALIKSNDKRDGELTFRRIYSYLGCKKPFQRLWINSLTTGAIREGFKNLKEGALYDNLYTAADCRARADFLIGINAGSAFGMAFPRQRQWRLPGNYMKKN
jgi:DNA topoisomerase-3